MQLGAPFAHSRNSDLLALHISSDDAYVRPCLEDSGESDPGAAVAGAIWRRLGERENP
jgi:hypothetical protein